MATKTKRGRKPKQGYLDPSMEPESIPELDQAAEIYYDAMQARCKLSKEEDEAKNALIDCMKSHKTKLYTTADGLVVSVVDKSNVKCKRKADAESNGEAEE